LGTLQWYQSEDSSQPEGSSIRRDGFLDFAREIVYCEREYYALSERFRAQVTFQQFVSIKNPRWSKDEVTHWVNIAEENRKQSQSSQGGRYITTSRWKEAQIDPTPIRSRELCYSCKEPWEPDHRCRGKGKVHIVEVHYDSEDEEMHEDATIDAYLEQSDEASDSCASEGQLDGQDDSTCSSSSHQAVLRIQHFSIVVTL
jgi:hypothetical protein